jgi:hypothetical protein
MEARPVRIGISMRERSHRSAAGQNRQPAVRPLARELDLETELTPDLQIALEYWRAKKVARVAPPRSQIDPVDLSPLLPRVMLVDVDGERGEFRYRLAGTGIVKLHGMELTNRGPRDLQPAALGIMIEQHYAEAVRRVAPVAHLVTLAVGEDSATYRRLILPLSDDGITVNRLLTVDSYDDGGLALRDCLQECATA